MLLRLAKVAPPKTRSSMIVAIVRNRVFTSLLSVFALMLSSSDGVYADTFVLNTSEDITKQKGIQFSPRSICQKVDYCTLEHCSLSDAVFSSGDTLLHPGLDTIVFCVDIVLTECPGPVYEPGIIDGGGSI